MENESFIEWKNLYTNDLRSIWDTECKELRKAAMVMHVLKKQFNELQSTLDNQLERYRKQLSKKTNTLSSSDPLPLKVNTLKRAEPNCDIVDKALESPPIKMKRRSLTLKGSSSDSKKRSQENTPPNRRTGARKKLLHSPDILDSSIIENTPEFFPKKFSKNTKLKKKPVPKSKQEISTQHMGITEMISLINSTDSKQMEEHDPKTVLGPDKIDTQESDKTHVELEEVKQEIILVEPMEVVRGNARKELPGWSCVHCKNFYECQNLPEEELLKKMNQCSRHRSKFQPPEDTFAGFWDLTLRSQK